MTVTAWLGLFFFIQILHFACTWKLYIAANRKAWEAIVPVYNAVVLMKIINRPRWWVILLFLPIINLIMIPVVWIETLRSFGKNTYKDTFLGIITLGLYIGYVNYTQELTHIKDRSLQTKSKSGEWVSSILFAVVAASIIHTYFIQPFTIPTSSLEKTLLVGDYLFVSKLHYGARAPMTALSLPMVHDTIPVVKSKSYINKPQLPYVRIPGFQKIKRNDIVVFNWPVDTLVDINNPAKGSRIKPIDKKSNYVKRAVGIPGDSLAIVDKQMYINGEALELPDRAKLQFSYVVVSDKPLNLNYIAQRFDITDIFPLNREYTGFQAYMTDEAYERLKSYPDIKSITPITHEKGKVDQSIFPHDSRYGWNVDNFGPIYIPKKGATVAITPETIPFYKSIIEVYEGREMGIDNKIQVDYGNVLLNGEPITEYTFLQDYYWMMGDNRHNSQDARNWGYVPFNHIVGKPVMVFMSINNRLQGLGNKIRTERLFTTVHGKGEPKSYLYYVIAGIVLLIVGGEIRKRRKK